MEASAAVSSRSKVSGLLAISRRAPLIPALIILIFIVLAAFADVITTQSPFVQDIPNRLQAPAWMAGGDWDHPLGTDKLGRDQAAKLIYGARVTLIVAVIALALGGGIGLVVGMASGYFGGWVEHVLMRLTDAALAIPSLFLAILFAVTLGPSFTTVIIAISVILWSRFARVIRGQVLQIKQEDFIAQARVAGCSHISILVRHIFPNVLNTWVVLLSLELGAVVIIEATLSFLGAGVPPPNPTWGSMVSEGREFIGSAWWYSFFPGLAITLVVLSFNMFGDWLRDTLDPKLRQAIK